MIRAIDFGEYYIDFGPCSKSVGANDDGHGAMMIDSLYSTNAMLMTIVITQCRLITLQSPKLVVDRNTPFLFRSVGREETALVCCEQ